MDEETVPRMYPTQIELVLRQVYLPIFVTPEARDQSIGHFLESLLFIVVFAGPLPIGHIHWPVKINERLILHTEPDIYWPGESFPSTIGKGRTSRKHKSVSIEAPTFFTIHHCFLRNRGRLEGPLFMLRVDTRNLFRSYGDRLFSKGNHKTGWACFNDPISIELERG